MAIEFQLNGRPVSVEVDPETPLLWVIRDHLKMKGTKFGCGAGICGACTVHVDGQAQRSCSLPVDAVAGASVTSIEGLDAQGRHPVQLAWIEKAVPQCGYCQAGMIMAVSALLAETPRPSDAEINDAITNICRCGTYPRIRQAIHAAAQAMTAGVPQ